MTTNNIITVTLLRMMMQMIKPTKPIPTLKIRTQDGIGTGIIFDIIFVLV